MKASLNVQKLAIVSAFLLASASSFAAPVAGGASKGFVVADKPSTMMAIGEAGISMPGTNPYTTNPAAQSGVVSFKSGPIWQTNAVLGNVDGHGYIEMPIGTKISETWRHTISSGVGAGTQIYAYRQMNNPLAGFPHFGGEVVAKVPGQEVYFGEWAPRVANPSQGSSTDLNLSHADRTVFYTGENPTTAMPNLVNAKYDVVGVNQYNPGTQAGISKGTLTANYGGGTGTLAGLVGTVLFNGTTISSDGTFAKNFSGSTAKIEGQFFGAAADALAGIYHGTPGGAGDMAFGGAKQ
ncbi:Slam-dependent surface lipoprotein [Alcaligenes phenolicus]|uniref:Transferrin-binding protein B C-lobe/N-lobe beta barrel domain-containing protein n=1 Tax=Alcaligenes phenolicus TaxID=232846 RepID=A0AAW5VUZ3_9BURK|nr:Slam-dependent surface lipoprotein [Alcaligenes phenolicus]MCX5566299.1 hypothetical protein [Alcaligenes phenolicus]